MVVVIITTFVACVTAGQGEGDNANKEPEAQHVFDCVLHKEWFLK